jgi:hypothetical protein
MEAAIMLVLGEVISFLEALKGEYFKEDSKFYAELGTCLVLIIMQKSMI